MTEQEVLDALESGEYIDAYDLLVTKMPGIDKRFTRLCNSMKKLIDDVQKVFPDAEYYTASGGFNILLGSATHRDGRDFAAMGASNGLVVSDGDY